MAHLDSYLAGENFSDDFIYRPKIIGHKAPRSDLLVAWAKGRKVLHVGFADHAPLIRQRVADGSWLHKRLNAAALVCHGVDVSIEAVAVAQQLGFVNTELLDIFEHDAPSKLAALDVELVLVPDVLEHLTAPAMFLKRLLLCLPTAEFVISVPNGISLRNSIQAIQGIERINTDHRVWFTPYTVQKTLCDGGLRVSELHSCPVSPGGSVGGRLLRRFTYRLPLLADCLVLRATAASGCG